MYRVAPFTGAWIEILKAVIHHIPRVVAPFTGAWIEILIDGDINVIKDPVAPFTGAWIEILPSPFATVISLVSHPSRVRGLKY